MKAKFMAKFFEETLCVQSLCPWDRHNAHANSKAVKGYPANVLHDGQAGLGTLLTHRHDETSEIYFHYIVLVGVMESMA